MRKWVKVVAAVSAVAAVGVQGVLLYRFASERLTAAATGASAASAALPALRAPEYLPRQPVPSELPFIGREGVDADGYPLKVISKSGFHSLLRARRFDELTRYIEQLQSELEADIRKEYWVTDAINAFSLPDPAFGKLLDDWVRAHPASFAPYAARGTYRSALGWHYRGTEFASKTSSAQFIALEKQLELARQDFERAIGLEPNALAAYVELIEDARHGSRSKQVFERAAARFPLSFRMYYQYMMSKTPRWGGSYAELAEIATLAERHVEDNRRLRLLRGFVDYARHQDLERNKDYLGALAALNGALKFGEHFLFYIARGDAKLRLDDDAGALADYDRALELRPESALVERALALNHLKRHEQAGDEFLRALEVDPYRQLDQRGMYADGLVFAGNQHFSAGRSREALAAYDKALLLQPQHAEAKRWRQELLRRGDPNLDPAEVERLVEAAERSDTFEAYLALDAALAKRGRYGEVVEHWTKFLGRHAGEGRAHLERGGAFTRMNKLPEAMADASKACELGQQQGCSYAQKLRAKLDKGGAK